MTCKAENDTSKTSTHIEDILYEIRVNEKGEIPFSINIHGVEHSFGITERVARSLVNVFRMNRFANNQ